MQQENFHRIRRRVVLVEPGQFLERAAIGVAVAGAREGVAIALPFVVAADHVLQRTQASNPNTLIANITSGKLLVGASAAVGMPAHHTKQAVQQPETARLNTTPAAIIFGMCRCTWWPIS